MSEMQMLEQEPICVVQSRIHRAQERIDSRRSIKDSQISALRKIPVGSGGGTFLVNPSEDEVFQSSIKSLRLDKLRCLRDEKNFNKLGSYSRLKIPVSQQRQSLKTSSLAPIPSLNDGLQKTFAVKSSSVPLTSLQKPRLACRTSSLPKDKLPRRTSKTPSPGVLKSLVPGKALKPMKLIKPIKTDKNSSLVVAPIISPNFPGDISCIHPVSSFSFAPEDFSFSVPESVKQLPLQSSLISESGEKRPLSFAKISTPLPVKAASKVQKKEIALNITSVKEKLNLKFPKPLTKRSSTENRIPLKENIIPKKNAVLSETKLISKNIISPINKVTKSLDKPGIKQQYPSRRGSENNKVFNNPNLRKSLASTTTTSSIQNQNRSRSSLLTLNGTKVQKPTSRSQNVTSTLQVSKNSKPKSILKSSSAPKSSNVKNPPKKLSGGSSSNQRKVDDRKAQQSQSFAKASSDLEAEVTGITSATKNLEMSASESDDRSSRLSSLGTFDCGVPSKDFVLVESFSTSVDATSSHEDNESGSGKPQPSTALPGIHKSEKTMKDLLVEDAKELVAESAKELIAESAKELLAESAKELIAESAKELIAEDAKELATEIDRFEKKMSTSRDMQIMTCFIEDEVLDDDISADLDALDLSSTVFPKTPLQNKDILSLIDSPSIHSNIFRGRLDFLRSPNLSNRMGTPSRRGLFANTCRFGEGPIETCAADTSSSVLSKMTKNKECDMSIIQSASASCLVSEVSSLSSQRALDISLLGSPFRPLNGLNTSLNRDLIMFSPVAKKILN